MQVLLERAARPVVYHDPASGARLELDARTAGAPEGFLPAFVVGDAAAIGLHDVDLHVAVADIGEGEAEAVDRRGVDGGRLFGELGPGLGRVLEALG
ncbi:MAG: hypothetical protein J0H57_18175, partial [Rhodospirillales bacterium]|nr:hypothetical protein [Rhodospirillales bacterium]